MGSRLERKSNLVRKRIENHTFSGEDGEEYHGSSFGGFSEYFRRKKIKLQNLDSQLRAESDKPQIFKGVVCHVNGYTQPSLNDLHVMIVQHGGGFIQYLDGKTMVTHIIASNLTPKKKEEFRRYRIVKPAWIADSVNAGKLLPWDAYRVVDEGVGQKVLGFENGSMVSQANNKTKGYREQTNMSWYTDQLKTQQTPQKPPSFTQTVTPQEEIEDDEYPMPEITSSMEKALESVERAVDRPAEEHLQAPRELLEVRTELETPPPSSPVMPPSRAKDTLSDFPPPNCEQTSDDKGEAGLRAREGSQEPDYSMAVVRDSEVLKNVSPERLAGMTAEEHNALLLSDPKIRKSTVVNPDFLEQYYRESRLHHLSTWKADLKSQLQALAAEKSSSQKARLKKLPGQRRYIMHVDFDSFFAAVSLKKNPAYKDKPAVVAHGGGSGSEIASCNYPARKFGISNGMWMKRAQQLCPELKVLPYDFPGYEGASRKFYDAILTTGGVVQSVSIDEALVDISAICFAESGSNGVDRAEGAVHREQLKADETAQSLRNEVLEKTGCAVSVGIGGNILQAKIALRKAKPAGQYQLKPEEVLDFIGGLEVQKLPGVAWSTGGKLEEIGIKFVRDIRECTREKLTNTLGPKTGEKLWEYARGIDKVEVGDQVVRKSVSAEVNWGVRFENQEQVDEFMQGLCGELHKRLVKERVKGKQLTMKVMRRAADAPLDPPKHLGHGKCDTYNKSLQLGIATNQTGIITKEAIAMMRSFNISPGELRGIGVQMQKLEPLKSGPEGAVESSQRRLQFKTGQPPKTAAQTLSRKATEEDAIQDDARTPEEQRIADVNKPSVSIEPVNASTPTKRQLNTLGTQFVLPTQVDAKTLAELPEDIRAKLVQRARPAEASAAERAADAESRPASRDHSPAITLPTESQLDPEILSALPDDVRAEILGFYKPSHKARGQAVLPQSPRKNRTLPPSKTINKQPIRRKRGGGLFAGKSRPPPSDVPTLTQANFVSRPQSRHLNQPDQGATTDSEAEPEPLDPDFLSALPADIRAEVLDQQRQAQLQRKGGIDLSLHQKPSRLRGSKAKRDDAGTIERHLQLPPQPAKPTFTARKFTELPDLRQAVKDWYSEFADEGPYGEDVEALVGYLRDVVVVERDLGKAVAVVRWVGWVIEEGDNVGEVAREGWEKAVERVREGVQAAARERGMGTVDFG
ncbi:deoxycytidyl transferase [Saxophila tyrrhenica]|uniref:DNA repair protein REV1 n=1 Tax=Saxophila tyrrhenica TaxID=1690608 RepID=A0AAV9P7J3_9PEZI|nr:deoxycytidyl transferase [Saxophila tyrrhenica]